MCLKHYTQTYRLTNNRVYSTDQDSVAKLFYRYGISEEDYDALWKIQEGKCAVCDKSLDYRSKGTHVDHNHDTNEVRGLLCHPCNNRVVGALENKLLSAALTYLDNPPSRRL